MITIKPSDEEEEDEKGMLIELQFPPRELTVEEEYDLNKIIKESKDYFEAFLDAQTFLESLPEEVDDAQYETLGERIAKEIERQDREKFFKDPKKTEDTTTTKTTSLVKAEVVCVLCGQKRSDTNPVKAYIKYQSVADGTEGSQYECTNTTACKTRRGECWCGKKLEDCKGTHKGGYYGGTSYHLFEGTGGATVVKCRHSATPVFRVEDINFYGGSESKITEQTFDDSEWLVVSLLGYTPKSPLWTRLEGWMQTLGAYGNSSLPQLSVDWPDYGIPKLRPGFWRELVALAKKGGYKHVLFYCMGGHGRTGTALASVLIECIDDFTADEAITFVRKQYCKEAIESKSQESYLDKLYEAGHPEEVTPVDPTEEEDPKQQTVKSKKGGKKHGRK